MDAGFQPHPVNAVVRRGKNMNTQTTGLPEQYTAWLSALPPSHLVAFKKNQWQFYSLDELQAPIRINRSRVTNATQLGAYVEMYQSHGAAAADGPKKTKFSFERLANSIAIAVENEEILFTDPSDQFSMWRLQPEDCEVRPLNCNIFDFIAAASVEDLDAD
jgi:hypothetical protein